MSSASIVALCALGFFLVVIVSRCIYKCYTNGHVAYVEDALVDGQQCRAVRNLFINDVQYSVLGIGPKLDCLITVDMSGASFPHGFQEGATYKYSIVYVVTGFEAKHQRVTQFLFVKGNPTAPSSEPKEVLT